MEVDHRWTSVNLLTTTIVCHLNEQRFGRFYKKPKLLNSRLDRQMLDRLTLDRPTLDTEFPNLD